MDATNTACDRQAAIADVIVIGAGLAGMACALELQRAGASVLLLERESKPGGRLRTGTLEGVPIDLGAHFLSQRYTTVRRLIEAAGLGHRLRNLSDSYRTGIWRSGSWHHLDYGRRLGLLGYSAVAPAHRARLALMAIPLARTVGQLRFFDIASACALDGLRPERLLGEDGLRYVFAPPSQAFCGYRPDDISMPLLALGARYPLRAPWTLAGGLGQLGEALAQRLDVRCDVEVLDLRVQGPYRVLVRARHPSEGSLSYAGRAAVIATTPSAALRLWTDAPPSERAFLGNARYTRHFHAYLRTSHDFAPTGPRGGALFMEILPRNEYDGALSHLSFAGAASDGRNGGLLFLAAHSPSVAEHENDEALADRLQLEAECLHPQLRGHVLGRSSIRWHEKVPLFPPGRAREVATARARMRPGPVQLAGDYLYGPLLEGAALAGVAAATRIGEHLGLEQR